MTDQGGAIGADASTISSQRASGQPRILMTIDEQFTDRRSSETAYLVTIKNIGTAPLRLLEIIPKVPQGVDVRRSRDDSTEVIALRYRDICDELTEICSRLVSRKTFQSKDFDDFERSRDLNVAMRAVMLKSLINPFQSVGHLMNAMERLGRLLRLDFRIEDVSDAEVAKAQLLPGEPDTENPLYRMFEAKLDQLKRLHEKLGDEGASTIAQIESDSIYSSAYVLRFPQNFISSSKYVFSVDATFGYGSKETPQTFTSSIGRTVVVNARSSILTLVAVLFAVLATFLRQSVSLQTTGTTVIDYFQHLANAAIRGPLVTSTILAIILFAVYELSSIGKQLSIDTREGPNWQFAALLGSLSGLFSDKVLAMLKILVGA